MDQGAGRSPVMDAAHAIIAGFYGKLPARGDFVRSALPRDFTDPWDAWLQAVIAGSRALMGEDWLPAFLEAPVWRFALPAGLCGARAALGLMLPSVDRAGRYFPLTFAALVGLGSTAAEDPAGAAWLDRCEAAGFAALEQNASPEQIDLMLGSPQLPCAAGLSQSLWWTVGGPRVSSMRLAFEEMPDTATYATMLGSLRPGSGITDTTSGTGTWEQPS